MAAFPFRIELGNPQLASIIVGYAERAMAIRKRKFLIIGPLIASIRFGAIGALAAIPLVGVVACSQGGTVTGEKPSSDAEMKTVVINVYGMT